MLNSSFDAIVPMLCVGAGALVIMLAEAFRNRGERMPLGVLGIIALVASAVSLALLWDRNQASFGGVGADNFGLVVSLIVGGAAILSILFPSRVMPSDGVPSGV